MNAFTHNGLPSRIVFGAGSVRHLADEIEQLGGRRALVIVGLAASGVATILVGLASSLPLFLAGAVVAGAAAGIFTSPQQAAVADVVGNRSRGGTAVATYQMMADLGAIVGSLAVGEIAQHFSFGWAFVTSGVILLIAACRRAVTAATTACPSGEISSRVALRSSRSAATVIRPLWRNRVAMRVAVELLTPSSAARSATRWPPWSFSVASARNCTSVRSPDSSATVRNAIPTSARLRPSTASVRSSSATTRARCGVR